MITIAKNWREIKPPLGSQINWGHPLTKGLVGCWLMNEGGGVIVNDIASNMNGTMVGGSLRAVDIKGQCVNFPNSDGNRIVIPDNNKFTFAKSESFTIATLFYPTLVDSSDHDLFRQDRESQVPRSIIALTINTANKFRFFYCGNIARIGGAIGTTTLSVNNLYMGVGVRDAKADNAKNYLNGKLETTSGADPTDETIDSDNPIYLGTHFTTGSGTWIEEFKGNIFLVYFWRRALSSLEIRSLYEAPYQFIKPIERTIYFVPSGVQVTTRRGFMRYGKYWG